MNINNHKLIYSIKELSILCGISVDTVRARVEKLHLKADFIEGNISYFKSKNIVDIVNFKDAVIRQKLEASYVEVKSGLTILNSKLNFYDLAELK